MKDRILVHDFSGLLARDIDITSILDAVGQGGEGDVQAVYLDNEENAKSMQRKITIMARALGMQVATRIISSFLLVAQK
jgi:hypothetical protein